MTTEPTDKQKEEAPDLLPCPFCGNVPLPPTGKQGVWREHYRVKCGTDNCYGNSAGVSSGNAVDAITFWNTRAFSARDAEIREVLEGLRFRHGCWCELPPNAGSPDHTVACERTQRLWEKLQPAKEEKDGD